MSQLESASFRGRRRVRWVVAIYLSSTLAMLRYLSLSVIGDLKRLLAKRDERRRKQLAAKGVKGEY